MLRPASASSFGRTSYEIAHTDAYESARENATESHRKTRRRFNPNLQTKRYWVPSLGRHVTLTVSVKGMKTIDRIGIEAALARIRRNTPDRLELTKLDPVVRKRVTFHETR